MKDNPARSRPDQIKPKAQPKPQTDRIIALWLQGYNNLEIAKQTNHTRPTIDKIVNTAKQQLKDVTSGEFKAVLNQIIAGMTANYQLISKQYLQEFIRLQYMYDTADNKTKPILFSQLQSVAKSIREENKTFIDTFARMGVGRAYDSEQESQYPQVSTDSKFYSRLSKPNLKRELIETMERQMNYLRGNSSHGKKDGS